jgi:hypothetical protein
MNDADKCGGDAYDCELQKSKSSEQGGSPQPRIQLLTLMPAKLMLLPVFCPIGLHRQAHKVMK